MNRFFHVFAGVLCFALPGVARASSIFGFESGTFVGWNVSIPSYPTEDGLVKAGNAYVRSIGTSWFDYPAYSPVEGHYLAELVVDNSALPAGGIVSISRSFHLTKGSKISGWSSFSSEDDQATDWGRVSILADQNSPIVTLWQVRSGFPGYWESGLPWTRWSWVAPADGTYTLDLRVGTDSDGELGSSAMFDRIAVPENTNIALLFVEGMITLVFWRRLMRYGSTR